MEEGRYVFTQFLTSTLNGASRHGLFNRDEKLAVPVHYVAGCERHYLDA
jgi:hypothetical protein